MKLKTLIIFITSLTSLLSFAQQVEPPFWWADMEEPELQIMIHHPKIAKANKIIIRSPDIEYMGSHSPSNTNYTFVSLNIGKAKPQEFNIVFIFEDDSLVIPYELKKRKANSHNVHGFNSSDIIYLITPDRFANGDTLNDNIKGYHDKCNRNNDYGRHGGDIEGIRKKLQYIKEMEFSAIWLSPLLENNMPKASYHGYAITDFYSVDPRFGSNEEYKLLIEEANQLGVKVIMDQITNHCGLNHWWIEDLPDSTWINDRSKYQITNHQHSISTDPHASRIDKEQFHNGWFVDEMPDLNQKNEQLAKYLTQNSIWWIEYSGIAGIRMDTYPYADQEFIDRWSCSVMNEYPNFTIVGEEWTTNPLITSYWQQGSKVSNYHSCLPSVMDFPFQNALSQSLSSTSDNGLMKIYKILGNDILYGNPNQLVIFADNHDMDRFYTQVGKDVNLYKMGMAIIFTMRGIPQVYYGSEVLLYNKKQGDHGEIRSEMPGGWSNHSISTFDSTSLSENQLAVQSYIRDLAKYRNSNPLIASGDLLHFIPDDNVYVYFRYDRINPTKSIMVIVNKNDTKNFLPLYRFKEIITKFTSISHWKTTEWSKIPRELSIPPNSVQIYNLR